MRKKLLKLWIIILEGLELPPFLASGPEIAKGQGVLVAVVILLPFPDKYRDRNPLSPETGTEQPDSIC